MYDKNYAKIFEESKAESLQDLNRENINIIGELMINEYKLNEKQNINEKEPINKKDKASIKEYIQISEFIDDIFYSNNRDSSSSNTEMIFSNNYKKLVIQKVILPDSINLKDINLYIYVTVNDNNLMLELDGKVELDNILYFSYKPVESKTIDIDDSSIIMILKDSHKKKLASTKDIIIPMKCKQIMMNNKSYLCFEIKNINQYNMHKNEMIGLFKSSDKQINILYKCKIINKTKNYLLLDLPKDFKSTELYNLIIMKEQLMIRVKCV